MSRFLQYINETNPNKGRALIDINQIKELLQTKYSHAFEKYKEGNIIYRGIPNNAKFLEYRKEDRIPRKSANTSNYYTLLLDSGYVKWMNKFPKRSMSLICTSSEKMTKGYGNTFLVFPENNAKIGICPKNDIWNVPFDNDIFRMDLFDLSNKILDIGDFLGVNLDDTNSEILCKQLMSIKIKGNKKIEEYFRFVDIEELEKFNTLFDVFINLLNHPTDKFILTTIENFNSPVNQELWTDASCLLINKKIIKDLF